VERVGEGKAERREVRRGMSSVSSKASSSRTSRRVEDRASKMARISAGPADVISRGGGEASGGHTILCGLDDVASSSLDVQRRHEVVVRPVSIEYTS
jgi:hypothetical protein